MVWEPALRYLETLARTKAPDLTDAMVPLHRFEETSKLSQRSCMTGRDGERMRYSDHGHSQKFERSYLYIHIYTVHIRTRYYLEFPKLFLIHSFKLLPQVGRYI